MFTKRVPLPGEMFLTYEGTREHSMSVPAHQDSEYRNVALVLDVHIFNDYGPGPARWSPRVYRRITYLIFDQTSGHMTIHSIHGNDIVLDVVNALQ